MPRVSNAVRLHIVIKPLNKKINIINSLLCSLRGRCLKGKGKEVLGARETRGAREEGGRRLPGDHCFSCF